MARSAASTSPETTAERPRSVVARPDVGAAGHIVQRSDLTTHRVVVDQATLIVVDEGRKRIRWSGGECVARPGDALTLHPGEVVDISNTPGPRGTYRARWLCWCADLLTIPPAPAPQRNEGPRIAQHARVGDGFRASVGRAFDALTDATQIPASIAIHRLHEVLLWLAERGFRFSPPPPASLGLRLRRLVAADPAAEWSMEGVAHATATSVPTLRRKLAAEGLSFRDLVQDVRMGHALALLQNTDTPVLQVAFATGYASPSRFTARFRARFGYLPTDIRGERRGKTRADVGVERAS